MGSTIPPRLGIRGRRYKMTNYYICGGADTYWMATSAKTLSGAKRVATKTYQVSVGGKIEIAELVGNGDQARFEKIAIKRGYDAWQQA